MSPYSLRQRRPWSILLVLCLALAAAAPLVADISGFVRVAGSGSPGTPIANAFVHVRTDQGASGVYTAADGSFTLAVNPPGPVEVAGSVEYHPSNAVNYTMSGVTASNGDTNLDIRLDVLPTADDPKYIPVSAGYCGSCHSPVYAQWQTSNHADAATNEWVLDLYSGTGTNTPSSGNGYVFRNTHDAGETGFCSSCHAPMAEVLDPGNVYLDEVTEKGAVGGVNCPTCHQLDWVDDSPDHLNDLHLIGGKASYRFPAEGIGTDAYVWGPLTDVTFDGMRASHSTMHKESRLCASCHQYNRPDNDVPGQHTYTEWLGSSFAQAGPGYRTCQDCHMPPATEDGTLCVFLAPDRVANERRQHTFIGSTPDMLQNNIGLTAVASEVTPGRIRVTADVSNFGAGHNFPTGVAIRNALLLITATWNGQPVTQVVGPTIPFWGSDDVPGDQPGDYAGAPGKGFAKVLEGQINGQGPVVRPVLFIDADGVFSDTSIPSGATDSTLVEFQLPPDVPAGATVDVDVRLLYRRAWRALQVTKGWTESAHKGPIEIEVARRQLQVISRGTSVPSEIPALGDWGAVALVLLLAAVGIPLLTRRH